MDESFIEKVKQLLKEREDSQKLISNLAIERQQALDEVALLEAKVVEMLGEAVKHGKEVDAVLFSEMDVLKEKERARSKIIDSLQTQLAASESRERNLDTLLGRIFDELHDAVLAKSVESVEEEPRPYVAEKMRIEAEKRIEDAKPESEFMEVAEKNGDVESVWLGDEHEGPHGYDGEPGDDYTGTSAWQKVRSFDPFKGIKRPLSKRMLKLSTKVTTTFVAVASVPFVLMAALFALGYVGIIIQPIYDLMAGWWQPWMGSTWVQNVAFTEPLVGAAYLLLLARRKRKAKSAPTEAQTDDTAVDDSGKQEEARVSKMLDEAFGDDNGDGDPEVPA